MKGRSANYVDIDLLGSSLMVGEISDSTVAGLFHKNNILVPGGASA